MICKRCKKEGLIVRLKVTKTRSEPGYVRRVRKCPRCGFQIVTEEK